MPTVAVVDHHAAFVEVLATALHTEPDLELVGHAHNVAAGIELVEEARPDVVIMDVRPAAGDGIAATAALTQRDPALCVLVLTAHVDRYLMRRAAEANARALLPRGGDLAGVLSYLRTMPGGGFTVHPHLLHRLVTTPGVLREHLVWLTPTEQLVLELLASGLEARAIADEVDISRRACRAHLRAVLAKLDAPSHTEAAAKAVRSGLIDAPVAP